MSLKNPKTLQKVRKAIFLGIYAALGLVGSFYIGSVPAFAQTSETMDMTPLIAVIVSIIPLFIMISLLDKLMGKVRS